MSNRVLETAEGFVPVPGQRRRFVAELMLLAVAAIWGSSYALTKQVTLQVTVLDYLALRFGLSALLLSPTLVSLVRVPHAWSAIGIGTALGLLLLGIFLCETWGVTLTTATNAAFLISLCVAFTPFGEWALLRQRPDRTVVVAVVMCMLGTALLSPDTLADPLAHVGDWLMLAAAVLRAIMVPLTRRLLLAHPIPTLALTALQSWVVFAGACVLLVLQGGEPLPDRLPDALAFWASLGFLVVFCTVFAFVAQNHAAKRLSATTVALLMGSEPLFGAFFGRLMFEESLSGLSWIGGALILGAIYPGIARHSRCQREVLSQ